MSNLIQNWYVLSTKPGCEKKVANLLSRKNIENYCPLKRQWNARKKLVLEPLFDSYVFVQVANPGQLNIRLIDNIVNYVYWLGKPAIVKDQEIELMKRIMNEYDNVQLEKIPFDAAGSEKTVQGTIAGNASMVSVKNNLVIIQLPSLGYMMLAQADQVNTELVSSLNHSYTVVDKYLYAV